MPELPEVEAVARTLRPLVHGRTILRCRVIHSIAVWPPSGRAARASVAALARGVRRRRITAVERRGKYLVLRLGRGCVVLHFRLDGQLLWLDSRRLRGHIDVAFEFPHGTLAFVDRRHFGRVNWLTRPEDAPGIAALGLDPLSSRFTLRRFSTICRASRRPLKLLLLDQTRVAGLGNMYSSEALWRARLDPRRRADRLDSRQTHQLYKAIVAVLHRALECCLDPAPDFRDPEWWFQGLERLLRVYDRSGRPCRRCRNLIRRIEQGGRATFFCPGCQQ